MSVLFMLILVLFVIRMNTTYNSKLSFKKYVIIKNDFISKLLISKTELPIKYNSLNAHWVKIKKEDRNKILVIGLVSYIITFLIFIVFLFCFPIIQTENIEIGKYIRVSTINEKIICNICIILIAIQLILYLINRFVWCLKVCEGHNKVVTFISVIVQIIFLLFCFFAILTFIPDIIIDLQYFI